jgi:hypothetical protein
MLPLSSLLQAVLLPDTKWSNKNCDHYVCLSICIANLDLNVSQLIRSTAGDEEVEAV